MTTQETIEAAVSWMESIAKDPAHGYSQVYRWGPDYDCSSLEISGWERAGVPVRTKGATYTGNMLGVYKKNGFKDITKTINLKTGAGLKRGDVLLNTRHHTATYCGNGKLVQASINELGKTRGGKVGDQTGREIWIRSYYNYPWTNVLRFVGTGKESTADATTSVKTPVARRVYKDDSAKNGKKYKVACSALNLRKEGNTEPKSLIISVLHKNDTVTWYGYHEYDAKMNHWLYVIANGKSGWVCEKAGTKKYLTVVK